ncbi:RGS17 protein, partial [Polypterus senegalus]|nr:RGS17 protein [Polypterus senegalus]
MRLPQAEHNRLATTDQIHAASAGVAAAAVHAYKFDRIRPYGCQVAMGFTDYHFGFKETCNACDKAHYESLTVRNEDENRTRRKSKSQDTKLETIPNCEACTRPTTEEVRLWAQSFDKLMKNPAGRNVFREFLRTEYSEENMLFWLACEDLKKEISKSVIEEKARMIYEDYISILSPKEVSLDSRVREVINRKMQDPTPHAFEDAQLQIYTLMHRDSYPRFLNSMIYKSLIQSTSRSSSES